MIAINNTVELAPWADILYFCDKRWFDWKKDLVLSFKGECVTLENYDLRTQIPGLQCVGNAGIFGLSTDNDCVTTGYNSGVQALNLAFHLRAAKIVLLGMDCKPGEDRNHFFGDHPMPTPNDVFYKFIEGFESIARVLKNIYMMNIINATPGTALTCFRRVPLREIL